jgi:hypothetical protein
MPFTRLTRSCLLLLAVFTAIPIARAENPSVFHPDPLSVQRYGAGYRYPQAGWIVLHVEGEPYERGYQHGRLMAPEIADFVKCSAQLTSPTAPTEGWRLARTLINALFLRRYEREYLEEMKGIADGAAAAGARFDSRPVDLVDIIGLNVWPEIETLDSALEALPTGLEGVDFPHTQPRITPPPKPMHCSAFAATGPATADGKVVFGHITMFGLYPSYYYNVWLDIKPAKGHRVMMQSYPGGIQSGLDYYMNDAGILVTETTIAQTKYDIKGMSLASRIRQALQYADSIDSAVEILKKGNNGLYTNEWLLADVKTNEIAMFELGTAKTKLYRSSRNEWFGGTEGFYWGCNNTKDRDVRLETIPGVNGRPENMCFCPSDRDKVWVRLYEQHKGKIDANFGKLAFTTPPIAAYHSLDAKFTTTDLAKDLQTWALFGPPLGRSWQPTFEERKRYPEIQPLVSNPWTILHVASPAGRADEPPLVMDLPNPNRSSLQLAQERMDERGERGRRGMRLTKPAWHGTILAKTDADTWLAAASAGYERIVAEADSLRDAEDGKPGNLSRSDRDRLAVELNGYRSSYLTSSRARADVPLAKTHFDVSQSDWFNVASGKGVLLLHELRHLLGNAAFEKMMDNFCREHAGKEVATAEFQAHVEQVSGKSMNDFFDRWLQKTGLPKLGLEKVAVSPIDKGFKVEGEIVCDAPFPAMKVEVALDTPQGDELKSFELKGGRTPFSMETKSRPRRVIIDKYGSTAKLNGGIYSVGTWYGELENTLIVYGTGDEAATNREAAEGLQKAIIQRHSNFTVPIKSDKEVTSDDLSSHHLLLIGRPDCNAVVQQFRSHFPIRFGSRSFTVRNDVYAHALTAIVAAADNPSNSRYSMVVIAGLSPEATLKAAPGFLNHGRTNGAEVMVIPNRGRARSLVIPAAELVKEVQGDELTGHRDPRTAGGQ